MTSNALRAPQFLSSRPRLFGLAYRILGSAAEADDVVQDAWVRFSGATEPVVDAEGFLVVTTTRLALNVLASARVSRTSYVGPWLPEPVDTASDPELGALRGEALSFAVLRVLETLGPAERAAYVLREAFDHDYATIASALELEEANVRQLVSRAKKRLEGERRSVVSHAAHARLLDAFVAAARSGDEDSLARLLAADVASVTDSGGKVRGAARVLVEGRARVVPFVVGFMTRFWGEVTWRSVEANGRPSFVFVIDGAPVSFLTIEADDDGIHRIDWVMNPDKLARIAAVAIAG